MDGWKDAPSHYKFVCGFKSLGLLFLFNNTHHSDNLFSLTPFVPSSVYVHFNQMGQVAVALMAMRGEASRQPACLIMSYYPLWPPDMAESYTSVYEIRIDT